MAFLFPGNPGTRTHSNAICRWHIATASSKTGCHFMNLPPRAKSAIESRSLHETKEIQTFPCREWVRIFCSYRRNNGMVIKNPGKLSIAAIPHFLTETFPENLALSSLNSTFFQEQEHKKRLDSIEYWVNLVPVHTVKMSVLALQRIRSFLF